MGQVDLLMKLGLNKKKIFPFIDLYFFAKQWGSSLKHLSVKGKKENRSFLQFRVRTLFF